MPVLNSSGVPTTVFKGDLAVDRGEGNGPESVITGIQSVQGVLYFGPDGVEIALVERRLESTALKNIIAKTLGGVVAGPVLIVGDSTSWGLFASGGPAKSWPKRLADLLTAQGIPALSCGYGAKATNTGGVTDARISAGAGWAVTSYGPGNVCFQAPSGTTAPVTYTIDGTVDTLKFYYLQNSGLGTLTAAVNGVDVGSQSCAGAVALGTKTLSFAATANPTITLTPSINTTFILGVEVWNSATPHLRVLNFAVAGSTSGQWADASNWRSIQFISAVAPAHTFVMLGRNDAAAGVSAAVHTANMQSILTAALATGTATVITPVPADLTLGQESLIAQYIESDAALCKALGVPMLYASNILGAYAEANAAGLMFDQIHENGPGHAAIARYVNQDVLLAL